jgi:hypothetical protein
MQQGKLGQKSFASFFSTRDFCRRRPSCNMTRKKWIIPAVVIVPLAYFFLPFVLGFFGLSQGYILLLAPVMFLGPIFAGGVVIGLLTREIALAVRIAVGIMTMVGIFASFFLLPPGAASWTLGLAANFRLTKHPAQIQQWVIETLDKLENGKLATTTNVEYWAVGHPKLATNEIPIQIQNLWRNKPSIGIATITENGWIIASMPTNVAILPQLTGGMPTPLKLSHCVAFSWYDTGILVGRPDFQSKWNPWYLHEITPGIYAFSGMK